MKNISHRINPRPVLGLYFISFEHWGYEEYGSFIVVASCAEEANKLTPDPQMNYHIGIGLGYECPKPDPEIVRLYRDSCGTGKSIRRIGDAWLELGWGDVPISSFNAF
jgi:hypothetical protein